MKKVRRVRKLPVIILLLIIIAGVTFTVLKLNKTYKISDFYDVKNAKLTSVRVVSRENGRLMIIDEEDYIDNFNKYLSGLTLKKVSVGKEKTWEYSFSPYEEDNCGFEITFYNDEICEIDGRQYRIMGDSEKLKKEYEGITYDLSELDVDVTFEYDNGAWDTLDLSASGYENRQDFEEKTKKNLFRTMRLLSDSRWYLKYGEDTDTINLKVSFTDANSNNDYKVLKYNDNVISGSVVLSKKAFMLNADNMVYQLTRLFLDSKSFSMKEGMAQYMQDMVQNNGGSVSYGIDIKDYAVNYIDVQRKAATKEETFIDILQKIYGGVGKRSDTFPADVPTSSSQLWSVMNYSFVDFLAEVYGFEKTVALTKSDDLTGAFDSLQSGGLDAIRSHWVGFLGTHTSKLTSEQINNIVKKYSK